MPVDKFHSLDVKHSIARAPPAVTSSIRASAKAISTLKVIYLQIPLSCSNPSLNLSHHSSSRKILTQKSGLMNL
jgi:hypothetical protein